MKVILSIQENNVGSQSENNEKKSLSNYRNYKIDVQNKAFEYQD